MTEMLILALLFGVLLGVIFFTGLWWTVRKGLGAENPFVWFLVSFVVRMLIVIIGFYWIIQVGQLQHAVVALFGFFVTRIILTRWVSNQGNATRKETKHAP